LGDAAPTCQCLIARPLFQLIFACFRSSRLSASGNPLATFSGGRSFAVTSLGQRTECSASSLSPLDPIDMHHHTAFGLHIACDRELPELWTASRSSRVDVTIRRDPAPRPPRPDGAPRLWVDARRETVRLTWSTVGTFQIRGTSEVVVSPYQGVPDATIRRPLLGVVLGVLLHRRGRFTLHASAVSIGEAAVAFIGAKGAGKSTLAAELQSRGHPLLTDDILAVDLPAMEVAPAYPQVKLRPDAAFALALPARHLTPLGPDRHKVAFSCRTGFDSVPRRLAAVFALDTDADLTCVRQTGRDAFLSLFSQSYALRFLGTEGATPNDFRQCNAVARRLPIFRLSRPFDLDRLTATAACVEETVRSLAGSRAETASR
jgi:hypothetical protein